jgi:hypothetical protein
MARGLSVRWATRGFWPAVATIVLAACSTGLTTDQPEASETPGLPTAIPSLAPAADLSGFDARVAEAFASAQTVPLAGLPTSTSVVPTCNGIGENSAEPATRICIASFPASEPIVTLSATSAGSAGFSGMMMVAAEMPDGIEGTTLPSPALGDQANLSRTWGQRGCSAVLAVREGTLVVSVSILLEPGVRTADCGLAVPTDYLETVTRGLLDMLAAYPPVGLAVDDLAARDRVVKLIVSGTLRPGERDDVTLPEEFKNLSDGGDVIAMLDGKDWTIVFFEARGVIDHYTGWVFRSSGNLGADEDPLQGGTAIVKRINAHWFHVETN